MPPSCRRRLLADASIAPSATLRSRIPSASRSASRNSRSSSPLPPDRPRQLPPRRTLVLPLPASACTMAAPLRNPIPTNTPLVAASAGSKLTTKAASHLATVPAPMSDLHCPSRMAFTHLPNWISQYAKDSSLMPCNNAPSKPSQEPPCVVCRRNTAVELLTPSLSGTFPIFAQCSLVLDSTTLHVHL